MFTLLYSHNVNFSLDQPDSKLESRFFIVRGIWIIIVLFLVLVSFTLWGEAHDLDRRFSAQFYSAEKGWYLADSFPWSWLYDYGVIPGILISAVSFLIWIFSRTNPKWAILRPYLLICGLTPIVASVLLVNLVLKDHTGRPRPREITQFSGTWQYKPALKAGIPGRGHSFPCGHCSIAFTLTSGVVFWQRSRKFALSSLSLGLAYGILMSVARIVQGGHYLSDALWSLGVVWLTVAVLYYMVFQPPRTENNTALPFSKNQKWKIGGATAVLLAFLALYVWTQRPFYKDHADSFEITAEIDHLEVYAPKTWKVEPPIYEDRKDGEFILKIQGFGPPYTTHYLSFSSETEEATLRLRFKETVVGYQSGFHEILKIRFPERLRGHVSSIAEKTVLKQ